MNCDLHLIRGGLWFLGHVDAVDGMEDAVGGYHVVECFGTSLCVHIALYVGEVAQEVEAVEHDGEFAFQQTFCDAGIPHQFVGVHGLFAVSTAAVHGDVG